MAKVNIIDTNFLLCYLEVPGKKTIANGFDWDSESIAEMIKECQKNCETIVIPLPMMIEAGNIIGHEKAKKSCEGLIEMINNTFESEAPWHSFHEQKCFWESETLSLALSKWKEQINAKIGLGDFLLLLLKDYYLNKMRHSEVTIWTGDVAVEAFDNFPIMPRSHRRESRY